jgi:hypothetical protein
MLIKSTDVRGWLTTRFFWSPEIGSIVAIVFSIKWRVKYGQGQQVRGAQVCNPSVGTLPRQFIMATLQWRAPLLRQRRKIFSNTLIPVISRRFHATQAYVEQDPSRTPNQRRHWSKPEIKEIYDSPLLELVFRAAQAHRISHDPSKVQLCTLMNIKSLYKPLTSTHP